MPRARTLLPKLRKNLQESALAALEADHSNKTRRPLFRRLKGISGESANRFPCLKVRNDAQADQNVRFVFHEADLWS